MDDQIETLDETPTQVAANTPAPTLNIAPAPAPVQSVPGTPVQTVPVKQVAVATAAQSAPVQSAQVQNAVQAQAQATEKKVEAAQVNLAVPQANPANVVNVVDSNNDGIADTSGKAGEVIDSKKLDQVQNVKKSKVKLKINFGKKTIPLSIGVIFGFLALIVGILLGKALFSSVVYNNSSYYTANEATSARVADGKNNITKAGNYKFTIPETYYYDKTNKGVLIYDTSDTFRIFIRGEEGIYDDIANAKTSVKATLQNAGFDVRNIKEMNIDKKSYIVAETIDDQTNRMIAFTKGSDTTIFYVEIVTNSNNYDYDALDLANDIIENAAEEKGGTTMENTDIHDISSIVIAAAETYKSLSS